MARPRSALASAAVDGSRLEAPGGAKVAVGGGGGGGRAAAEALAKGAEGLEMEAGLGERDRLARREKLRESWRDGEAGEERVLLEVRTLNWEVRLAQRETPHGGCSVSCWPPTGEALEAQQRGLADADGVVGRGVE